MAHAMPQMDGVEHRFLRVAGDEMSFHVALAGEGDPVLLLHGWPQHWWEWRKVIPALAEHHRVIAMDLRGFGWSDIAWTGFEKENMADDVVRVLEALEVDRARVVGHDWGGWIGYLLALRRPDLVRQLVAVGAPPPWAPPTVRGALASWRLHHMLTLASPLGRPLVSRRYYVLAKLKRWSARGGAIGKAARRIYARDLRASTRARASSLLYRTFVTREAPALARGRYRDAELAVPTLAVYGARDPLFVPGMFAPPRRGAGNFRVETIADAGHFVPEETPGALVDRIGRFFTEGDESPATATREAQATGQVTG
jgi:pimeloyl-ACP methyl ester carboxylesterase